MPTIVLPNGGTRFVPYLNPGDQLASGKPTALDAEGTIAGEQGPGGFGPQVLNPGNDESAPATALPMMRHTTQPRIIGPSARRLRPGSW